MKSITLSLLIVLFAIGFAQSQTLVTTEAQNRNAVLEEYTGIYCTYCPDGHAIGNALLADNPGRVVLINVHTGYYADPNAGDPDFRTTFGDGIAAVAQIDGYPSGSVNRHVFPGYTSLGGSAMSRGAWTVAASEVFEEVSPVNVGASSSFNPNTRELTVNVELYYTSDAPDNTNLINVALVQNDIIGPQTGGGMGANYIHGHMLRDFLTGQWGDEVTTTTSGTFIERTYIYTVPADFNDIPCIVEDCDIAVYVSESSHQEIYSGVQCKAIDGTTLVVGGFTDPPSSMNEGVAQAETSFDFTLANYVGNNENFDFELTHNAPDSWDVSYHVNGTSYNAPASISLTDASAANISIKVTPSDEACFATFSLEVKSSSVTEAPVIHKEIFLVANVNDLIVHNQGSWTNGSPWDFDKLFRDGVQYARTDAFDAVGYKLFKKATQEGITFESIFFNVGWTSPGLTDDNVALFTTYLDNGGRLLIAGQDIGWGTWDADGNGTVTTKAFFTDYLAAVYDGDGSSTNNSISAIQGDPVFGRTLNSGLIDVYGGNMYPEELSATGTGVEIFHYNSDVNKTSAVRNDNGTFKTVYLGFDPAMVSDEFVAQDILRKAFLWFHEEPIVPAAAFEPQNGTFDFIPNGTIKLHFSEAVRLINDSPITNPLSLITLKEDNINGADVLFTASINADKTKISITPSANLALNSQYFVEIGSTTENAIDESVASTNSTFTVFAPAATAQITPINNEVNVSVSSVIRFSFNQKVYNANGSEISLSNVGDLVTLKKNNAMGEDVPFSAHIDFPKKVLTITPSSDLLSNQVYYATLSPVSNEYGVETADLSTTFTTENLAGITENRVGEFTIYPNPANSNISLNFKSLNVENATASITDISGRLVYSKEFTNVSENSTVKISTEAYSNGIYFVSFEYDGNKIVKKLVIQD